MTDLLTTRQVQALLRVDRTTIYRMVESGQLPAIRVGKQWRFAQSEVEGWLRSGRSHAASMPAGRLASEPVNERDLDLRSLLPLACVQSIQDLFAEMLGVMIVVTDMQGQPITGISNPCGFFAELNEKNPGVAGQCVRTWQQLAGDPALAPKFSVSEMDLLCARGLIRVGTELKGMVVLGGIAPEAWPPGNERIEAMAHAFELAPSDVQARITAVHRLDQAAQARALYFVQRIADALAHIIEERSQEQGRLVLTAAQLAFS